MCFVSTCLQFVVVRNEIMIIMFTSIYRLWKLKQPPAIGKLLISNMKAEFHSRKKRVNFSKSHSSGDPFSRSHILLFLLSILTLTFLPSIIAALTDDHYYVFYSPAVLSCTWWVLAGTRVQRAEGQRPWPSPAIHYLPLTIIWIIFCPLLSYSKTLPNSAVISR